MNANVTDSPTMLQRFDAQTQEVPSEVQHFSTGTTQCRDMLTMVGFSIQQGPSFWSSILAAQHGENISIMANYLCLPIHGAGIKDEDDAWVKASRQRLLNRLKSEENE